MPIPTLDPRALNDRMQAGPLTLIDVRTPAEYTAGHVPGARSMPLDALDVASLGAGPVHVICQSGVRSRQACEKLTALGVAEVIDIAGGTSGWKAAGLPIDGSGGAVFGVERQVRSIIGAGVLTGAILALTVDPWFALISAFFGGGLLMAGITDLCPLALLVARLPWNRSAKSGGSCCVLTAKA
jgi:rhodanese-related sulfurtransferase